MHWLMYDHVTKITEVLGEEDVARLAFANKHPHRKATLYCPVEELDTARRTAATLPAVEEENELVALTKPRIGWWKLKWMQLNEYVLQLIKRLFK